MITKSKKKKLVEKVKTHENDTGSPEVQISILTERIQEVSDHLKEHQKDIHSRRGLLQLVADRRRHMNYLQEKSPKRFNALMKKLNIKKKA
ncbi:MAG: 30S ribosomal protein S15 [Candidatus Paceibacterota bacterium]